jgi:hypothetical protein
MNMSNFITWLENAVERTFIGIWNILQMLFWLGLISGVIYLIYVAFTVELPRWYTAECERRWQQSGLDAQFKPWVGCMVYVNGRWVPEANVQLQPTNTN